MTQGEIYFTRPVQDPTLSKQIIYLYSLNVFLEIVFFQKKINKSMFEKIINMFFQEFGPFFGCYIMVVLSQYFPLDYI